MKYFTLDRWIADLDIAAIDVNEIIALQRAYRDYLKSIRHRLPRDFQRMLKAVCIHDGNLLRLDIDLAKRTVLLKLHAGDASMKRGCRLWLRYGDVSRVTSSSNPRKGLPGPYGFGDVGNDEIELLSSGRFEHRILFSSGIEFAIEFAQFEMRIDWEKSRSRKSTRNRSVKRRPNWHAADGAARRS
jgi:hypothetical protein